MGYRYYLDEGFVYRIPDADAPSGAEMQVMDAVSRTWMNLTDKEFGFHAIWYGSRLSEQQIKAHRFPLQGQP